MKYELVAIDIDGTLLTDEGLISEKTKIAIKNASQKGVIFTIASGRSPDEIQYFQSLIGINDPIIAYNGAQIFDVKKSLVLKSKYLQKDDAKHLIQLGNALDIVTYVTTEKTLYVNKIDNNKQLYGAKPVVIKNISSVLKKNICKIIWIDDAKRLKQLCKDILPFETFKSVKYFTSAPVLLEFVNKKISKGISLKLLAKMLNIPLSNTIAIGDGDNDIEMIEIAGLGVAMKNASEDLKKKAKYITASNNKDGIAEVIENFILNN